MACKVSCCNLLDLEFSFLREKFPKSHNLFVLRSNSEEEASFQFILKDNTKIRFQVNFLQGYPKVRPLWTIDQIGVENLDLELNSNNDDILCPLVSKCVYLVNKLCTEYNLSLPIELQGMVEEFCELFKSSRKEDFESKDTIGDDEYDNDEAYDIGDDEYEDYSKYDDVIDYSPEDDVSNQSDWAEKDGTGVDAGISAEHRDFLEKMRIQSYRTSTSTSTEESIKDSNPISSAIASDRLLKELRDIYKSQAYKDKVYNITIEEDNLYSWEIELLQVDTDSGLHKDLMTLAEKKKDSFIRIHVTFTATYPYEPPFVRILSPVITGGFVFPSGAICMELLTPQGWSSAYSLESVILQVSATMSKGGARVNFESDPSLLSMHSAQNDFKMIVNSHKEGWYTPPPNEG